MCRTLCSAGVSETGDWNGEFKYRLPTLWRPWPRKRKACQLGHKAKHPARYQCRRQQECRGDQRAAELPGDTQPVLVLTVNAAQARTALFGANGCAQRLGPRAVLIVAATIVLADARSLEGDPVGAGLLIPMPLSQAAPQVGPTAR